jgi:hypothetical protein
MRQPGDRVRREERAVEERFVLGAKHTLLSLSHPKLSCDYTGCVYFGEGKAGVKCAK